MLVCEVAVCEVACEVAVCEVAQCEVLSTSDSGSFFDSGEKAFRTEQFRGPGVPSTPPGQRRILSVTQDLFWLRKEGFQDGTVPWAWSAEYPSRTTEKSCL